MKYPHALQTCYKDFQLYLPKVDEVKTMYEQACKTDPQTSFPFWSKIWPAAYGMTQFLEKNIHFIEHKIVVEFGAGIGLPSLYFAKQCKEICITDYDPDAVELIHQNIQLLELSNASAYEINWNDFENIKIVDTIILSDINYEPSQFGVLLRLITHFLAIGVTILIATPQRIMASPFVVSLSTLIKATYEEIVIENEVPREISILVLHQ